MLIPLFVESVHGKHSLLMTLAFNCQIWLSSVNIFWCVFLADIATFKYLYVTIFKKLKVRVVIVLEKDHRYQINNKCGMIIHCSF